MKNKDEIKKVVDNYNKTGTARIGVNDTIDRVEQVRTSTKDGFLTFLKGHLFPIKGFTSREDLEGCNRSKELIHRLVKIAHKFIKVGNPKLYCPAVKEIYRVFNIMIEREFTVDMENKMIRIRDIICTILQDDLVYRYRVQDMTREVDIKKLFSDEGDEYWMDRRRKKRKYNYGGKDPNWEKLKKIGKR